jgi:hypothetical protein
MEKDKGCSLLVPLSGAASSSSLKSSEAVDNGLQLMQKMVDARMSKMSSSFVKQVGRVFELVDHCMQNTNLFGEIHPRRYSIESLSSAETGNVHDINSPEPSNKNNTNNNTSSSTSYPYMYARPPVGSSPVGILRKKSLPGEDGRDYGLAGSPKKKKQSFSGILIDDGDASLCGILIDDGDASLCGILIDDGDASLCGILIDSFIH